VPEEYIIAFGWASQQDLDDMIALALRVNDFMSGVMYGVGIKLIDFKIEIGRHYEGDFQRPACGISSRAGSWTRTCSAAIWAIWRMPTRKWRSVWA